MKELFKTIKAIASCASDDETRTIHFVNAATPQRLEATNGHVLIRLDTVTPHGLAPGLYDAKKSIALLRAGVLPTPVDHDGQWPNTEAVIADALKERAPAKKVGFVSHYIATVAEACTTACDNFHKHVSLELGGELDPAVIRAHGDRGTALGLIMPVRL